MKQKYMNARAPIFTLFYFTGVIVSAQTLSKNFVVTTSTPYTVVDAGSKEYVALGSGDVLMAKMGSGVVNLQKFDTESMKEVSRNTYEDLPKGAVFQDVIKLGEKVFYFYEAENKKAGNYVLYCREINTANASFLAQREVITTGRGVVNSPSTGELSRVSPMNNPFKVGGNKFLFYKSFDGSKLMIQYRLDPISKSDDQNYDEIGFYVFDSEMIKLWGSETKMPYTEKVMNNVGYTVSSDGVAMMLLANRESKKYELISVDDGGLKKIALNLNADQLVRKMEMREDESGNFLCGGFYANGIEFKMTFTGSAFVFNANGLMYFEMDKDGNLLTNVNYDFPIEFIKQNLNERLKKDVEEREAEGKAGISDLILTDVRVKSDGSVYFVGEQQYVRTELWGPSQEEVYHFANIILVKVDDAGKLAWMKKLPKNQAGTQGGGQMSFSYMEGPLADYTGFADNPKNIALGPDDGIPAAHKDGMGGFLTTYKIDHKTGNLEKHTICDLENINGITAHQFKAWRIFNVSPNVFMMEVYIKGGKDAMVKFELKS